MLNGKMIHDRPIRINYSRDEHRERTRGHDRDHHDDGPRGQSGGARNNGAPPFGYPPSDEVLKKQIVQVSEMVVRRDLDPEKFVAFVALKDLGEKESKSLSFLLGGEGAEFFRWRTHCAFNNLPGR